MRSIPFPFLILWALTYLGCGLGANSEAAAREPFAASVEQSLEVDLVAAFSTLQKVGSNRWTVMIQGQLVTILDEENRFKVIDSTGAIQFEVSSVAIRSDFLAFDTQSTPPETSAIKMKWLGKLLKSIGELLGGGGGGISGASGCATQARLTCGAGCVASVTSTFVSCRFVCSQEAGCGGLL